MKILKSELPINLLCNLNVFSFISERYIKLIFVRQKRFMCDRCDASHFEKRFMCDRCDASHLYVCDKSDSCVTDVMHHTSKRDSCVIDAMHHIYTCVIKVIRV